MNHDQIIKKVSLKESMSVEIVDLVIKDSLKNLVRELANTDLTEAEVSGFGKVIISENKLRRRLDKCYSKKQYFEQKLTNHLSGIEIMEDVKSLEKKLRTVNNDITNLEKKFNRLKVN